MNRSETAIYSQQAYAAVLAHVPCLAQRQSVALLYRCSGAALLNGAARDTDAGTIVAILANPADYIAHSSDPDKAREVVNNLQVSQQGAALAVQMIMGTASTVGGKGSRASTHEEAVPDDALPHGYEPDNDLLSNKPSGEREYNPDKSKSNESALKQGVNAQNFFEGTTYTNKVKAQASSGDYHAFPQAIDGFAANGKVTEIIGGDGVKRFKLEIPGEYQGKSGVFEYIRNPDGTINHRLFVPKK